MPEHGRHSDVPAARSTHHALPSPASLHERLADPLQLLLLLLDGGVALGELLPEACSTSAASARDSRARARPLRSRVTTRVSG